MLFASILNASVMLGNDLQQMTSADDIFRCIIFLVLQGLTLWLLIMSKCCLLGVVCWFFKNVSVSNSVDPDQTAPVLFACMPK